MMNRFPAGPVAVFLAAAAGLALARWTAPRTEFRTPMVAAQAQTGKPPTPQTAAAPGTISLPGALEEQRQWIERLRTATTEDIAQMLLEAQKISDPWRRRSLRELLLEQYARLDPEGGVAFFETFDGRKMHGHFLKA